MIDCDVAVIGGGPAGSTVGSLLKKYDPSLDVVILEAEKFPRDHVGESQLPVTPRIVHEMGAWDKIEAANFPVKVGASYRWGPVDDNQLWHNYFIPDGKLAPEPRPGKYEGQRTRTAFQVDRSIYDKILLDHCRELGCQVYEETRVTKVETEEDRVLRILAKSTNDGRDLAVHAKYYVDASGTSGLIRNAMRVTVESPTSLRNIAVWDYWQNAEWAETIGVGGTMVLVMSFGWGWLWFIPMSPTRTSIGLITSADYYKSSGKSTEELYLEAIEQEPRIRSLVAKATRENKLQATKDWSFIADRMSGDNWFLAGDVCGFADPILAAGMSLAHMGARRVAYSILEINRGELDPNWVKDEFNRIHKKHIGNHIRFADYWYSANGRFTDLKEYCTQIAKDSGLTLDPDAAFQWLGNGGFTEEMTGVPFAGTYRVGAIKAIAEKFSGQQASWAFKTNNIFELNLEGATQEVVGLYEDGRITQIPCYFRDGHTLPVHLFYGMVIEGLKKERELQYLTERLTYLAKQANIPLTPETGKLFMESLEVMITEGWVTASYDPSSPLIHER